MATLKSQARETPGQFAASVSAPTCYSSLTERKVERIWRWVAPIHMTPQHVLISGIGIAGPTLAYWLTQYGFAATLVDRAPAARTAGYVIDFWGLGYGIAERMGLAREIDRIGYQMRELRMVGDRGERLTGFGTRVFNELTGGRFATLARADLSRLIFGKIESASEALFDEEIVSLRDDDDSVIVMFKRGGERRFASDRCISCRARS